MSLVRIGSRKKEVLPVAHRSAPVPGSVLMRKIAYVVEYLQAHDHVGLLFNEPLGAAELPFI
jgi:hypothetical protein